MSNVYYKDKTADLLETDHTGALVINHEMVKTFCNDDIGRDVYQRIKSLFHNHDGDAFVGLTIVMYLVETAYFFDNKPFRVLSFIKSYLSGYISLNAETARKFSDFIIDIIETRDDDQSSGIKFIIQELKCIDYNEPDDTFRTDVSLPDTDSVFKGRRTNFFQVDRIGIKMTVKGVGIAMGVWKSKKKRVEDFLFENKDEVREQLKKGHTFIELLEIKEQGKTKKQEGTEYKNDFRKEREAEGKEFDLTKEIVRRHTARIVNAGSGNLSDFLTPSGDASSKLYKDIVEERGLPKGSVRGWLRAAIDDGSLKEEIKKQSTS